MIRKFCVKNPISIKMSSSITLMNDSSVLREQEAYIQTNSLCMSTHMTLKCNTNYKQALPEWEKESHMLGPLDLKSVV